MSSTNILQETSSLTDISEIRYHKACKEIDKLVKVNLTLKKQTDKFKQINENLLAANQNLLRDCDALRRDRAYYEDKAREL